GGLVVPIPDRSLASTRPVPTAVAVAPNADIFVAVRYLSGGVHYVTYLLQRFTSNGTPLPDWDIASQSLEAWHSLAFSAGGNLMTLGSTEEYRPAYIKHSLTRYT